MEYISKIRKIFVNRQFIIFILIGCINTISGALFSALYALLLGEVTAFIPGYITGTLVSYLLNSIFTFKEHLGILKFAKFALSTVPNFLIQFITVYIGVNLLSINHIICYGMAAVVGVPVTFLILKLFVYTNKNKD